MVALAVDALTPAGTAQHRLISHPTMVAPIRSRPWSALRAPAAFVAVATNPPRRRLPLRRVLAAPQAAPPPRAPPRRRLPLRRVPAPPLPRAARPLTPIHLPLQVHRPPLLLPAAP